jgi:lipid A 3-O-deacylase PagL
MLPRIQLIAFFLFLSNSIFSQTNTISLGLKTNYGFIIPHSESIKSISDANPWTIELDFSRLKTDDKTYQQCACYPKSGFVLSYINFDNPEIIGHGITLVPFIEPFFGDYKKLLFSLRAGSGIVYLSNPYDSISNPQNFFYSTHLSFVLIMNFRLNYFISDNININLSANYHHISNGGIKTPNKGINFPMASIGVNYIINPVSFGNDKKVPFQEIHQKRNYFIPSIFYTQKEIGEDGRIYPLYGVDIFYKRIIGRVSTVNLGGEFVVDRSVKRRIELDTTGDFGSDYKYFALETGHTFLMGKFWFSTDLGLYLYKNHTTKDQWFQRYCLNYIFNKKYHVGVSLKAHRHVASFLDFRIGLVF